MEKLTELAIKARIKKESKERDAHLDAYDAMVNHANSLRHIHGSQAVNKVINVNYYLFL